MGRRRKNAGGGRSNIPGRLGKVPRTLGNVSERSGNVPERFPDISRAHRNIRERETTGRAWDARGPTRIPGTLGRAFGEGRVLLPSSSLGGGGPLPGRLLNGIYSYLHLARLA